MKVKRGTFAAAFFLACFALFRDLENFELPLGQMIFDEGLDEAPQSIRRDSVKLYRHIAEPLRSGGTFTAFIMSSSPGRCSLPMTFQPPATAFARAYRRVSAGLRLRAGVRDWATNAARSRRGRAPSVVLR